MAELLILDFDGVDEADYLKVNKRARAGPGDRCG